MKRVFFTMMASVLLFASCSKTGIDKEAEKGDPVTIEMGLPGMTRGSYVPPAGIDDQIETVRILAYEAGSGKLAYNSNIFDLRNAATEYPLQLTVWTGTYDFVFIANEHLDAALSADLGNTTKVGKLSELKKLSFARSAFNYEAGVPTQKVKKVIPAMTMIEKVAVIGNKKIQVPSKPLIDGGTWDVELTKIGVKVNLIINLTQSEGDALKAAGSIVYGLNIPRKAYIFPNVDNSASMDATEDKFYFSINATDREGYLKQNADNSYTLTYDRLILPESYFTPNTTEAKALTFKIVLGTGSNERILKAKVKTSEYGYTLPRGTQYQVTGTIKDQIIEMIAKIEDWKPVESEDDIM